MIESDKKVRKGLPPRREVACLRVEQDIVIPAGTILRQSGPDKFEAKVGPYGNFSIFLEPGDPVPEGFRRVVA